MFIKTKFRAKKVSFEYRDLYYPDFFFSVIWICIISCLKAVLEMVMLFSFCILGEINYI